MQKNKTNKTKDISKISQRVLAIVLAIFVVGFGVLSLALPDEEFSENENRVLSTFPEFSAKALFSGDYIASVEKYLQDHFPYRSFFVSGKAEAELALGKDQNNGVYLGKDGYLIGKFESATVETLDKKIEIINSFVDKLDGINFHFALAPSSNLVNADKLPQNKPDDDIQATLDYINGNIKGKIVELSSTLLEINKVQQLYYKTDHHWNTFGAYYAYCEIMKSMGETPIPISEYENSILSEQFKGTMFSKSGFFATEGEIISVLQNKTPQHLSVEYVMTGKKTDTLFEESHLQTKDKYAYFLDGNHPIVSVENQNAPIDSHIVIVKDSYANIAIPFLADSYSKITVIDLRFYAGSVSQYAQEVGASDILMLYNIDGFQTDSGIYKLR